MDIIAGDKHDALLATYQTLEVARLNAALQECGVDDAALRRSICETYFFNSGQFLDSGWFEDQGSRVRPNVHFEVIDAQGKPAARCTCQIPPSARCGMSMPTARPPGYSMTMPKMPRKSSPAT